MRSLIDSIIARYRSWKAKREQRKFDAAMDAAYDRALANLMRSSTRAYHKHLNEKYGTNY